MASSWFSTIQETIQTTIKTTQTTIQSTLPPDTTAKASDIFEKLTLQSPELRAEHDKIDAEERRKEVVKNALSELLPWETRDEERAILVDECRDSILALSTREETFTGVRTMDTAENPGAEPGRAAEESTAQIYREGKSSPEEGSSPDAENIVDGELSPSVLLKNAIRAREKALAEQRGHGQNLAANKGEGSGSVGSGGSSVRDGVEGASVIPALLESFDLDAHVGLIRRMLDVDPKLVEMHMNLSGGKVKEIEFWRNYFYHCAICRLDIGLDLDEVWGDVHLPTEQEVMEAAKAMTNAAASVGNDSCGDDEITFDQTFNAGNKASPGSRASSMSSASASAAAVAAVTLSPDHATNASAVDAGQVLKDESISKSPSPSSDFEMISGPPNDNLGANDDEDDLDLDDLDAEIARELES